MKMPNNFFTQQIIPASRTRSGNFAVAGFKLSLICSALALTPAYANETGGSEKEETEVITVTGSRIKNSAATSQLVSIDRTDIDARGFTSVEELLQSIPQMYSGVSTLTTSSNTTGRSTTLESRYAGQSGADLRGLGRSNVLVLVNGRRQAVSAAAEVNNVSETGVNLNSIPFSAIERVEVLLDGASAVYGADAIGGVINVILRKDYIGADLSVKVEQGANGGDSKQIEGSFGHSWDSGNVTLTLSHKSTKAIRSADVGFTTQDFTSLGGHDGRSPFDGTQIGIYQLRTFPFGTFPSNSGYLALTDDGTTPLTLDDLNGSSGRVSSVLEARQDNVPTYLTSDRTNTALVVSIDQLLLDEKLRVFADLQYTNDENDGFQNTNVRLRQFADSIGGPVEIPTSNAFNNTGETLYVNGFYPSSSLGVPEHQSNLTTDERKAIVLGAQYEITENWSLDTSYQLNTTESKYQQEEWRLDYDALQVLANSDDPNIAFNPFGNHSAQNDLSSALVNTPTPDSVQQPSISKVSTFVASMEGLLGTWSGGEIRVAFGGELRKESLEFDDAYLIGQGSIGLLSDLTPERDVKAAFAELSLPLVGKDNAMPGIKSLELKVAGRHDSYKASEPSAAVDNTYEHFSPNIGVSWEVTDGLKIRANWGEAFRAPNISQLYKTSSREFSVSGSFFAEFDPYLPEGADTLNVPDIVLVQGANTDLEGETSESKSVGVIWSPMSLEGFYADINYSEIEISNQITDSNAIYLNTEFWRDNYGPTGPDNAITRDADGFIIGMMTNPININGTTSKSLDAEFGYEIGEFDFVLRATKTLSTERRELTDFSDLSGTDRGLPEWVGSAVVNYSIADFSATLAVNYTGSYTNVDGFASTQNFGRLSFRSALEQGLGEKMASYTTVDFTGRYFWQDMDMVFTLGVKDLFEADKPFYNNARGAQYDFKHANIQGRTVFLNIKKDFSF